MEAWREYMAARSISPAQAAEKIQSGNRIVTGHAAGAPDTIMSALIDRADSLRDVEITHMLTLGECAYCRPEYAATFRLNALYTSAGTRAPINEGRADFTPMFFSQIPELFQSPDFPLDVALVQVSEPDSQGRVSFGVSVDYTLPGAKAAKTVIAEVNPNMPYIGGGALMPVQDIDWFVPVNTPLKPLGLPAIGPVEQAIGRHVASLINDGDCLQLGIGAIPDAALTFLDSKKDLGIHSEMISDGVMRLAKAGVITGARKNLHPGKIVITFAMGSPEFYAWMHNNPQFEAYPVDYVNNPCIVGQNDNLISINSALSVDLLGQVAADSMGPRQFSGVGGQVDFVRGARFSKGGKSIIALPATAAKGSLSRICGALEKGQPVTTSRHDVEYIVTEHGIAHLRGKTTVQRARALIAVAAPEFQEGLRKEARDIYNLRID